LTTICSWGIRGGVGNTSVVAMLGDALHQQGESVLMVDLNSTDMLRLHFNVPYSDPHGWAAARLKGTPWQEQAFSLVRRLVAAALRHAQPALRLWIS